MVLGDDGEDTRQHRTASAAEVEFNLFATKGRDKEMVGLVYLKDRVGFGYGRVGLCAGDSPSLGVTLRIGLVVVTRADVSLGSGGHANAAAQFVEHGSSGWCLRMTDPLEATAQHGGR